MPPAAAPCRRNRSCRRRPRPFLPGEHSADDRPGPLPWWRRLIAAVSAAAALLLLCNAVGAADLTALIGAAGASSAGMTHLKLDALLLAALLVFTLAVSRRAPPPVVPIQVPRERRRLPKRTVAAAVMILLLVPVTLFVGLFYLDNKKYYFISLLILLECMAPFFLLFEGRKPQARELVVIAVLCAVAVAGRAALFMLPQCKPVMALTILAGVAFGGRPASWWGL